VSSIFNTTDIYYNFARVKSSRTNTGIINANGSLNTHSGSGNFEFLSSCGTFNNISLITQVTDYNTSDWTEIEVDYIGAYNISQMQRKGIKNDAGIPFAQLTNEEIKSQLDIWVENGFPTVVEKLVSKSDNLFNGKFNTLTSLESENLISNSDLLIDSNSDGIPDGFSYNSNTTDKTLVNGIAKFTATAAYSGLYKGLSNQTIGDIHYHYARIKTDALAGKVILGGYGGTAENILSNDFQFISRITNPLTSVVVNGHSSGYKNHRLYPY